MRRLLPLPLILIAVSLAPLGSGAVVTGDVAESFLSAPASFDLPFSYDLYTFRGTGGRTTIVAAFAVEASALDRRSLDGESRYRFDVGLIIADTARRVVYRSDDSVFVAAPRSLPGEHLLHTFAEIDAPPSPSSLHRVVMTDANTPGVGQLHSGDFPVPDYRGEELMISDVAFGMPGGEGGWRRGSRSLALLPTSQFPESAFDLYYELYNLAEGGDYRTEMSITTLDDDGVPKGDVSPVRAEFTERVSPDDGGMLRVRRAVQSVLDAGSYRLAIRVTEVATGAEVARVREFRVRDGLKGTSMVPALPWRGGGER